MQRRFFTKQDVEAMIAAGATELTVADRDVVTAEALELATKLGLPIKKVIRTELQESELEQKLISRILAPPEKRLLEKLFQPISIGTMRVKNRLALSPMMTNYAAEDGSVTERLKAYYQARARGGVGLIIVGATFVHPSGRGFSNQLGIHQDGLIDGLRGFVETVHKWGAKIAVQLHHAGRQTYEELTGMPLLAPSPIPCSLCRGLPVEMTKKDIKRIINAFGEAAHRAKEAGFDAVEIHGGHGYLVSQFFSRFSNNRTDEYGGSLENRARFPLEVLRGIRQKVGDQYPVTYRINSEEFVPGGVTIEESKTLALLLAGQGIDLLNVSGGVYASAYAFIQPAALPRGFYVKNAHSIKQAVGSKVPVMVVGRIKDPVLAAETINSGKADMIAVGRALLADPDFPRKVEQGNTQEIRKCIACLRCGDRVFEDQPIWCLVNPMAGREWRYDLDKKADKIKRILIIGGGPGGLEAARVAALRGHRVFLYERSRELGGWLKVGATPPHKEEINDLLDFLILQVNKLGVDIKLGEEVTAGVIDEVQPDEVIMATGSKSIIPPIPGVEGKNVVTVQEILLGADFGKYVVIIGGGSAGCETAEFLAARGARVTIVEMLKEVATDLGSINRGLLLERMKQLGIDIVTQRTVKEIRPDKVIVETNGRTEELRNPDTVVLAVGVRSVTDVGELLSDKGILYHKIGDCIKPRSILDAIHDGFEKAYEM
jgi:2,4-dienoyl-CoA reductase-like NADH-dependent reductase (Old Yellow Enzyme family)/thioredoxin reductase